MRQTNNYDVLIIGGGVLGCFTARNLMRYQLKVALVERHPDVCMEISRANTAIVYAGYDTKPGTIKTELTRKASLDFNRLCEELDVDFVRYGSLMVAYGPNGIKTLHKKLEQGIDNGINNLKLLNRKEALDMEPDLSPDVAMALYSPDTGTVNPWELGIAAAENAVNNGVELFLNHTVNGIEKTSDGFLVMTPETIFKTKTIVNCAGLFADRVSELVAKPYFRIVPTCGEYLVLDTKAKGIVNRVIFQENEDRSKGIAIVPTTDGHFLVGASESPAGEENFSTTINGLKYLETQAKRLVPDIPLEYVIRSFATLRPNPYWVEEDPVTGKFILSDRSIHTFNIGEPEDVPGFINLAGIKTPGLTCANEIGKYAADLIISHIGNVKTNKIFDPAVAKKARFAKLSFDEQKALAKKNPAYGRIVCRCGQITEAEIVEAIHMRVGATTLDGVKRRAGSGLGRCQGSFCTEKIMEILARELGSNIKEIRKDKPNSYLLDDPRKL